MNNGVNDSNFNNSISWASPEPPTTGKKDITWEDLLLLAVQCIVILIIVVGNTLVILAVATTRRLRTVTNCYVMSLAVADCLVGVFVMPPAVAVRLMGSWTLGPLLCDIWISLDVLCCTASILSLVAISVDRYLAITQPLHYSRRRRSKKLALIMIFVVWFAAFAITCPPILGWYDKNHLGDKICRYNMNPGYVIFSAMGSFFIPLIVMLYVYAKISCVVAKRHDKLGGVQRGSRKSQKFASCYDESECLERGSFDGEEGHPSVVKCTSLSGGEQFTTSLQPQRSLRSHHAHFSYPSELRTDYCNYNSRFSFNGSNKISRPESLIVDMGRGSYGVSQYDSSSRVSSFRRESKTTQTLTIVVGGFVACWLPFFITYLLNSFLHVSELLMALLTWLGWINSAINPFIYAFYSVDFRTAFWRLTFRRCCNKEKNSALMFSRNR